MNIQINKYSLIKFRRRYSIFPIIPYGKHFMEIEHSAFE